MIPKLGMTFAQIIRYGKYTSIQTTERMKMISSEIEIPVVDVFVVNEFDDKTNHWTRVIKIVRYAGARSIILYKSDLDNSVLGYDYELGLSFIEFVSGEVIFVNNDLNKLQKQLCYSLI